MVRTVDKTTITGSTVSDITQGYDFRLSDLPSYAEFQGLFDSYRIDSVEIAFIPISSDTTPGATFGDPRFYTAIDFDSGTAISKTTLEQYDTFMCTDGRKGLVRRLKPRAAIAAYSGAFTSYAMAPQGSWIDCASPDVQHYGVLVVVPQQTTNVQIYYVSARYHLSFAKSR